MSNASYLTNQTEALILGQPDHKADLIRKRNRLAKQKWRKQKDQKPVENQARGPSGACGQHQEDTSQVQTEEQLSGLFLDDYQIRGVYDPGSKVSAVPSDHSIQLPNSVYGHQAQLLVPAGPQDFTTSFIGGHEMMFAPHVYGEGRRDPVANNSSEVDYSWVHCTTPIEGSACIEASNSGVIESKKTRSRSAPDNNFHQDENSMLHVAVRNRSLGIVHLLLAAGAECNATDISGMTPLHVAVQSRDQSIMRALMSSGADINAKDSAGKTPLDFAVGVQDEEMVRSLIALGAHVR